jgi:hypothetical protein
MEEKRFLLYNHEVERQDHIKKNSSLKDIPNEIKVINCARTKQLIAICFLVFFNWPACQSTTQHDIILSQSFWFVEHSSAQSTTCCFCAGVFSVL